MSHRFLSVLRVITAIIVAIATCAFGAGPDINPPDFSGNRPLLGEVDGYWLFRAPVDSADEVSGFSVARRHGGALGNGRDVGVLWRETTPDDEGGLLDLEERHCGAWVQFFFDEAGVVSPGVIENIYCHTWIFMDNADQPGDKLLGFSVGESYDASTYYHNQALESTVAWPDESAYYRLAIYHNDEFFFAFPALSELWGVSFKTTGGAPQLLSYPNQRSFCLVNLEDEATLQQLDRDADGLNDYQELFVCYTDPYDSDTDDDGHDDRQEYDNGQRGWDPYDWGTVHVYQPDGITNHAFVKVLNYQDDQPLLAAYADTLYREFKTDEYQSLWSYDGDYNSFPFYSDAEHPWSLVQLNFHYRIEQDVSQIKNLNVFFGGLVASYDLLEGNVDKAIELKNTAGDTSVSLPAKFGHTAALYFAPFADAAELIDQPGGDLWLRVYSRSRLSNAELQADFAEIWVIVANSELTLERPTAANPLSVSSGDTVYVDFTFIEEDVPIVSGLEVDSLSIGDSPAMLLAEAVWTGSAWRQFCVVPDLTAAADYDLRVFASTPSAQLDATAAGAICYVADYICGDADGNQMVNISDVVFLIAYIFASGPAPEPLSSGDADCNGLVNISDAVYLIAFIFGGGPEPCASCPQD